MRDQGVPFTPELLKAVRERDALEARDGRNDHEIWPDMAPAVLTFMAMATQWNRDMMGAATGLNYAVIQPTAAMLELTLDQQAFHDIRVLESETLRVIRSKRRG